MVELTVYTDSGVITYTVVKACDNFTEAISEGLSKGIVQLETADGGMLFINPMVCSAIEVKEIENNPPQLL